MDLNSFNAYRYYLMNNIKFAHTTFFYRRKYMKRLLISFALLAIIAVQSAFATSGPLVNLGTAAAYGGLGGSAGLTNQGTFTVVNGNIGSTCASTLMTGFHDAGANTFTETPLNIGAVNGIINCAAPLPGTGAKAAAAQLALDNALTAYNYLAGLSGGTDPGSGELGGLTLSPGVYKAVAHTFMISTGNLTLDAQNNPNAVWVFQMDQTLTVGLAGQARSIILINGAQAQNVFWQVGSAATINAAGGGIMAGTIISNAGITFSTAGITTLTTLNGRALSLSASVTMVNTIINVPPGAPTLVFPAHNAVGVTTTPTLTWTSGIGGTPVKYLVKVSASSDFSVPVIYDSTANATGSYTVASSLTNGTKYYWAVAGENTGGTGNWSIDSFTILQDYALTITSAHGTVVANPTPGPYAYNTVVSLTATAAVGYTFSGWTGDATGTTNPVSVTMDAAKNVTANYTSNTYALTITSAHGTVVANPTPSPYVYNTVVSLTATAAVGYTFSGWSGDATGTANPVSVTMDAAKNVTANYTANTYALTITSAHGTVVANPTPSPYAYNTVVSLTATAAVGYTFSGWTGDATGATNPVSVTMDAAKSVTANYTANTYALTITSAHGTVVANPTPSPYAYNTVVSLTATPAVGYTFSGWSGDATGATNPVSVTMDAAKSVTANYTANTYALTITSAHGTVVANPTPSPYAYNTVVSLTATAAVGYTFSGWTGDATGTANPVSVTMDAAKSVTANYTANTYALTITSAHGTVIANPTPSPYAYNTVVSLTATAAVGYTFSGWTGDVSGTTNPVSVTMDAAKNVTANYTLNTYALTIISAHGTVVANPSPSPYAYNTVVSLTATAAAGYTFSGWTGDVSGTTNPVSVTMDAAKSVTANYTLNTYALTIISAHGTVVANPSPSPYAYNTVVSLTATAAVGYTFSGWSGDASGTANPVSVTMDAAKNVTANYTTNNYALTITSAHGTVVANPTPSPYAYNTVVSLTATAAVGYTFSGWTGDATGTTNPVSVTMDAAKSVTANYTANTYALTIISAHGTVVANPTPSPYAYNTVVSLTATAAVGYTFSGWSGDATGTTNPVSVTMDAAKSVTANYTANTYALTIISAHGTVVANPTPSPYAYNTVVSLTATAAVGYTFSGWSGDATGTTNPVSVTMDAAKSVTANYTANTYALTIISAHGTVVANPTPGPYAYNTVVSLTATAAVGYTFSGWSGDATGTTNPVSVTMDAAKNVTANYTTNNYALTIISAHGTVVANPTPSPYAYNTVVTLTATAAVGYTFSGWSGDATGTTNPVSVTMDAAKNVTANYTTNNYALTITSAHGTVVANPTPSPYAYNTVVSLTATAAVGYTFSGWTGDATGTTNPVSVTMDAAKSVTANYTANTYALTIISAHGTVVANPTPSPYVYNTVVSLTATAAVGYTFSGWTGDATGTTNPVSVTMDAAKNVTANYTIKTYALTVISVHGTTVKTPNLAMYDSNSVVGVKATSAVGYSFTGWTGDLVASTDSITVTMNSAKTITAHFLILAPSTVTLTGPDSCATGVGVLPTLTWTAGSGGPADMYLIKVSTCCGFCSSEIIDSTTNLSYTISKTLLHNTTYYWEVAAKNTNSTSGYVIKSFTTILPIPSPVTITCPTTNTTGVILNPKLEWSNSAYTTLYHVQISTTSAFTTMLVYDSVTANSDSVLLSLSYGTKYYWRVNAQNSVGTSAWICDSFSTLSKNIVALTAGWNLVSMNVLPLDSSAATVFGTMAHCVIVKNGAGQVFWPAYSINEIGTIHIGQAYQIYTTACDTIRAIGKPVPTATTQLLLSAGWSMIAYLPQTDMSITTALSCIVSQITIVKNIEGQVFWPDYGINDIGTMRVGQGYGIHMKAAVTLTYPSGLGKSITMAMGVAMPKAKHFVYANRSTGSSATMLLKRVVENTSVIADSSEIGAFDASGVLVGSGVVMNGKAAFTVWGDNTMTKEKDGLALSEAMTFKIWTPSGNEYMASYVGTGTTGYADNALMIGAMSIHRSLQINTCALASAYPNPFRGNVRIGFDVATVNGKDMQNVEVNVYDVRGSLIQVLAKGLYRTGRYSVTWDGSEHIGSNMYIVTMKTENFNQKMKLFKVK